MKRDIARRQATSRLVLTLLGDPELEGVLNSLSGPELKSLVARVGIADAGDLLALVEPRVLTELLDEEVWGANARGEDAFDVGRFCELLESLAEHDVAAMARSLAAQPEEFVVFALSQLVVVLPSAFVQRYAEDDEEDQFEKRLSSARYEELSDCFVIARHPDQFDIIVELLCCWDEFAPQVLDRVLERLGNLGQIEVEDRGDLCEALDDWDALCEQAVEEREERRAALGYVSSSDARAFLRLPALQRPEGDAISRAYVRRLQKSRATQRLQVPSSTATRQVLLSLLPTREATPKLEQGRPLLHRAMDRVAELQPGRGEALAEELAFLINVLLSAPGATNLTPAAALLEVRERIEAQVESAPQAVEVLAQLIEQWGLVGLFRRDIRAAGVGDATREKRG